MAAVTPVDALAAEGALGAAEQADATAAAASECLLMCQSALLAGHLATFMFTAVYMAQILLNYQKKSTEGFSTSGLLTRLVGGSFFVVNAVVSGEYIALLIQIALYTPNYMLFMYLPLPVFPYLLARTAPWTMAWTNSIKPASQVLSSGTQFFESQRQESSRGCSLTSQHFNFIGGLLGLYMCYVIPPVYVQTTFLYINSVAQAASIYYIALRYDGLEFFLQQSFFTAWLMPYQHLFPAFLLNSSGSGSTSHSSGGTAVAPAGEENDPESQLADADQGTKNTAQ